MAPWDACALHVWGELHCTRRWHKRGVPEGRDHMMTTLEDQSRTAWLSRSFWLRLQTTLSHALARSFSHRDHGRRVLLWATCFDFSKQREREGKERFGQGEHQSK